MKDPPSTQSAKRRIDPDGKIALALSNLDRIEHLPHEAPEDVVYGQAARDQFRQEWAEYKESIGYYPGEKVYKKTKREFFLSMGLCIFCGELPAPERRSICVTCIAKRSASSD